ncbi:MAG: type II toxin-antitoxin system VapC family toxin [Tepidisphaeraceae bacterium]
MVLVDANILLYAEDQSSVHHGRARAWWDEALSGSETVCLCWQVIGAFIRIATNRRIFSRPLTVQQAIQRVQSWLDQPCVHVVAPTADHWTIFARYLKDAQAIGNLVSDAHLAALATEHGCQLFSADVDFARFRGLKWKNPLV